MTSPTPINANARETNYAEPEPRALPQHRIAVTLGDGRSFTVRVRNQDRLNWERTAARKKWPSAQDSPFFATTFLAFSAAARDGLIDMGFDAFCDVADDVRDVPADEDDIARPTQRVHERD